MIDRSLPEEAFRAVEAIRQADIVIGIPSYNNAGSIGHVVRAVSLGVAKYFPHLKAVVINSDGDSTDGTRDSVLSAREEDLPLVLLSTPWEAPHLLSFPYRGTPGKGSAMRLIFRMAFELKAKACVVVDADLRSITPEWVDLLLQPIVARDFDYVAPYYLRHKYDGTITNNIVYPLTRALYGVRVRQPIGGDFGVSARLIDRYVKSDAWDSDVARFGIDIWMTTIAIAEGYRVCQGFLGAKLHDAKDPGSDLSAMLEQVVGSVFLLMQDYEEVWKRRHETKAVDLFGFRYAVGLDSVEVNMDRMMNAFLRACQELEEIWSLALEPETYAEVMRLALEARNSSRPFLMSDELWARVIFDFACAHKRRTLFPAQLLRSLTPLYLARVASFVEDTRNLDAPQVEGRIERLCLAFEAARPYLEEHWFNHAPPVALIPKDLKQEIIEV